MVKSFVIWPCVATTGSFMMKTLGTLSSHKHYLGDQFTGGCGYAIVLLVRPNLMLAQFLRRLIMFQSLKAFVSNFTGAFPVQVALLSILVLSAGRTIVVQIVIFVPSPVMGAVNPPMAPLPTPVKVRNLKVMWPLSQFIYHFVQTKLFLYLNCTL